jgi:hypothetical protein
LEDGVIENTSGEKCQRMCADRATCLGFTVSYDETSHASTCHLKGSLSGRKCVAHSVSGWKYAALDALFSVTLDLDYNGGGLDNNQPSQDVASPVECEAACLARDGECVAYTFFRGGNFEGECRLKGLATATREACVRRDDPDAVSARLFSLPEADFINNDAFKGGEDSGDNDGDDESGCNTGIKIGGYQLYDEAALSSKLGFAAKAEADNSEACEEMCTKHCDTIDACKLDDVCRGFTFVGPEKDGSPGQCTLFSHFDSATSSNDPTVVSGWRLIDEASIALELDVAYDLADDLDDGVIKNSSGEGCLRACADRIVCLGFSVVYDETTDSLTCHLKGSLSGRKCVANAVSGWKYAALDKLFDVMLDLDYKGGNLPGAQPVRGISSPVACEEACVDRDGECVAYSFYRGGKNEGQCYLKGLATATRAAAERVDDPEAVSAHLFSVPEAAFLNNDAFKGGNGDGNDCPDPIVCPAKVVCKSPDDECPAPPTCEKVTCELPKTPNGKCPDVKECPAESGGLPPVVVYVVGAIELIIGLLLCLKWQRTKQDVSARRSSHLQASFLSAEDRNWQKDDMHAL